MKDYLLQSSIKRPRHVIALNGSKCCGKTSIANLLEEAGYGFVINFFETRDMFYNELYQYLDREHLKQHEVNGASSLGWFALDYHWRVKRYADHKGLNMVFDHYLADYWVQMLGAPNAFEAFTTLIMNLQLPSFQHGHHFYLDIDYDTYLHRREQRHKELPDIPDTRIIERDLYERRRSHYRKLVDAGWLTEIDATQSKEKVFKAITKQVKK